MKKYFLLLSLPAILFSCDPPAEEAATPATIWFKGNTHAHTIVCGHADTSPDSVALWYLERDYNFLILSEHNHFIDPATVNLPADRRSDFILIPGEEVSGRLAIHTTGMNTRGFVEAQPDRPEGAPEETKTEVMQYHTDSILKHGGLPILNHPNFVSGAQASDILPVDRLHMFELYNGHPAVYNWGNDQHAAVEEKWDSLLTAGKLILGISSDDAHQFQTWGEEVSNPGRGWVMVNSNGDLSPDAITQALARGNFYATNGVILSTVSIDPEHYALSIDSAATMEALRSPYVTGKQETTGMEGYTITFISENGRELQSSSAKMNEEYHIGDEKGYVRAKVRYTRKLDEGKYESFFAWTQPLFLDERAELLEQNEIWEAHSHSHPH